MVERRSTEWLVHREKYLREKLQAYEYILNTIREIQRKNRENMVLVEVCESLTNMIETQMNFVAQALNLVQKELEKREVKTAGAGPINNQ
ncbi:MAG: hypothetical protein QXK11_11480 [Pyrobaculum sp.]|uniref:hypothetical protein n=1 Tax=Pyrobaculum sp. TaxID=2004705 RepID=UPI0031782E4C